MYSIVLKKRVKKFIDKLPKNEKLRIVAAIKQLPNGEDIKKLKLSLYKKAPARRYHTFSQKVIPFSKSLLFSRVL